MALCKNLVVGLVVGLFAVACGGGNGGDNRDSGNPDGCLNCPDGGGEDVGDNPVVHYGWLIVTSTPVEGGAIELDGEPSGEVTPHTFENLPVGTHSVLLSFPGRLQVSNTEEFPRLNRPAEVDVITEGTEINIVLYYDLTGRWVRESDGEVEYVEIWTLPEPDRLVWCPTTPIVAGSFSPLGMLCLEPNDTLSLCKTRAEGCGGYVTDGQILDNGRRVEYTACFYCETPDQYTRSYAFNRL